MVTAIIIDSNVNLFLSSPFLPSCPSHASVFVVVDDASQSTIFHLRRLILFAERLSKTGIDITNAFSRIKGPI